MLADGQASSEHWLALEQEVQAHHGEQWPRQSQPAHKLRLLRAVKAMGCPKQLRPVIWPVLLASEDKNPWPAAEAEYARLRGIAEMGADAAQAYCSGLGAPEDYYPGVLRMLDVDVPRAPHNCSFLLGDARPHGLARLCALLEAFCLAEPELGYWQGYADIAAPLLDVFEQDYQAFWALRQLLAVRLRHAFATALPPPPADPEKPHRTHTCALDMMWEDIHKVNKILKHTDPQLHRHMAHLSMPFCQTPAQCSFQMIHIYFSRELPLEQLQVFWETMWAHEEELRLLRGLARSSVSRTTRALRASHQQHSAHADIAHADSAHADIAHADSAHADIAHADSAHADIAHADSAHTGITHADSAHAGIAHADSAHSVRARRASRSRSSRSTGRSSSTRSAALNGEGLNGDAPSHHTHHPSRTHNQRPSHNGAARVAAAAREAAAECDTAARWAVHPDAPLKQPSRPSDRQQQHTQASSTPTPPQPATEGSTATPPEGGLPASGQAEHTEGPRLSHVEQHTGCPRALTRSRSRSHPQHHHRHHHHEHEQLVVADEVSRCAPPPSQNGAPDEDGEHALPEVAVQLRRSGHFSKTSAAAEKLQAPLERAKRAAGAATRALTPTSSAAATGPTPAAPSSTPTPAAPTAQCTTSPFSNTAPSPPSRSFLQPQPPHARTPGTAATATRHPYAELTPATTTAATAADIHLLPVHFAMPPPLAIPADVEAHITPLHTPEAPLNEELKSDVRAHAHVSDAVHGSVLHEGRQKSITHHSGSSAASPHLVAPPHGAHVRGARHSMMEPSCARAEPQGLRGLGAVGVGSGSLAVGNGSKRGLHSDSWEEVGAYEEGWRARDDKVQQGG